MIHWWHQGLWRLHGHGWGLLCRWRTETTFFADVERWKSFLIFVKLGTGLDPLWLLSAFCCRLPLGGWRPVWCCLVSWCFLPVARWICMNLHLGLKVFFHTRRPFNSRVSGVNFSFGFRVSVFKYDGLGIKNPTEMWWYCWWKKSQTTTWDV